MDDLLSNEEIDTLMEMFRSEEADIEEVPGFVADIAGQSRERDRVVSSVDLLKPNRLSREQMQDLERMFESSAKAIGATMSDRLRYEMHCDSVAVEQMRFGTWLQLVGNNVAIYIINAPPLETPLFISVTTNLLYGSVDRVLGGHGRIQEVPKEFSAAELVVADAFLEPIFARIAASIEDLVETKFEVDSRFTNPSMAHILPAQDVVLSVHFQMGGDFLLGDLRIAFPYSAIEPHLGSLGMGPGKFKQKPGSMRDNLSNTVQAVEVGMCVELGNADLSVQSLLGLKIGDVVPLDRRLGEPLIVPVEGIPKFKGQVGTVGKRLAFQVASVME